MILINGMPHSKWQHLISWIFTISPEYLQTWINYEESVAYCAVYQNDKYMLLYPFLKKKITGYDLGADYYDIQTAYGYGGVISNAVNIPVKYVNDFNKQLDDWCLENNIISEFIRTNPLHDFYYRKADYIGVRYNVYITCSPDYKIPKQTCSQKRKESPEIRTRGKN